MIRLDLSHEHVHAHTKTQAHTRLDTISSAAGALWGVTKSQLLPEPPLSDILTWYPHTHTAVYTLSM